MGDTCYSWEEDVKVYNPDGKEIVARENEISACRKEDPGKAYFNCHTDITIPYEELGELYGVRADGSKIVIISNGKFVLPGTEELQPGAGEIINHKPQEKRRIAMAKVGIVMGSDSDMPIMAKAADILEELGIDYEMTIISAHREPDVFFEYAKTAEEKGFKVIIAGAGMAAHLPGMCAAIFPMPVHRYPDAYHIPWRKRFPVLHRTDALRHSGGNRGHQRRHQCGPSCGKDPGHLGSRHCCGRAESLF